MSEFRRDALSGDWIIMAPERAKRPHDFIQKRIPRKPSPKSTCPFEDLEKSGNWPPILTSPEGKEWHAVIIPNKYPALTHKQACAVVVKRGPYESLAGIGHHDLAITRDHQKNLGDLSIEEGTELFLLLQKRYQILIPDRCLAYTSTFFNWGITAGASVYHPHYQILTLPIIPPAVAQSLEGSRNYFRSHKRCSHCDTLAFERKAKKRVIEENKHAMAVVPFASKNQVEIEIYPKRHRPYFEKTPRREIADVVALVRSAIRRVKKYLNDPDFNFFIHTAPIKNQNRYYHYHWHLDIVPKAGIPAGFELGTGVDINVVDPDAIAAILKGKKFKASAK